MGGYDPLKQHPFFDTISWSDLHLQTPPKLTPYLPAMSEDDEDCYGNVRYLITVQVSFCPGGSVFIKGLGRKKYLVIPFILFLSMMTS